MSAVSTVLSSLSTSTPNSSMNALLVPLPFSREMTVIAPSLSKPLAAQDASALPARTAANAKVKIFFSFIFSAPFFLFLTFSLSFTPFIIPPVCKVRKRRCVKSVERMTHFAKNPPGQRSGGFFVFYTRSLKRLLDCRRYLASRSSSVRIDSAAAVPSPFSSTTFRIESSDSSSASQ